MKTLSEFDKLVLSSASDDYEAAHTLVGDLSRDLGFAVSEQQVIVALSRLTELGLVQAFEYDVLTQRYQPIQASALPATMEPWFLSRESMPCDSRPNYSSKPTP